MNREERNIRTTYIISGIVSLAKFIRVMAMGVNLTVITFHGGKPLIKQHAAMCVMAGTIIWAVGVVMLPDFANLNQTLMLDHMMY